MSVEDYIVFENFLSPEDSKLAATAMLNNPQSDGRDSYATYSLFGPEVLEDNAILFDWDPEQKINLAVKHAYSFFKGNYSIQGSFTLNRCYGNMMHEGSSLAPHADWDPDDSGGYSASQKPYIAALFLTDDYEGGELFFPDLGVELHPKVGSLVLFTGHKTVHGVNTVSKGVRVNVIIVFHDNLAV